MQHTLSTTDTEHCIHRVLHHAKIDCLPLPASLSALCELCCTQFSTFPLLQVNQWIESRLPSHMPPDLPPPDSVPPNSLPPGWLPSDQSPPDKLPPSTPPILIYHPLQVYVPTCPITASKCIWKFTWSRPPSVSPNSLNHRLLVHLWIHSISASNWISKLAQSQSPIASLSSLNLSVSKWISEFTRSQSPSGSPTMLNHDLLVHLHMATVVVWRYRGIGDGQSAGEYIFSTLRSRSTSSYFHFILSYNENAPSIFPNFWSHLPCSRFRRFIQLHGSSTPGSIISSHPIATHLKPEPLFDINSIWMLQEVRQSVVSGLSAFSLHRFTTTATKCISEFTQSLGLQVHLWVHSISVPKCISNHV